MAIYLIFDTETTGLPRNYKAAVCDVGNWPRLVELSASLVNEDGKTLQTLGALVYPDGFEIPDEASRVSGITTEMAKTAGSPAKDVLEAFGKMARCADYFVCHNLEYDFPVLFAESIRCGVTIPVLDGFCTKAQTTELMKIPNTSSYGGTYKWPKLKELHTFCFGDEHEGQHRAGGDVEATKNVFFHIRKHHIGYLDAPEFSSNRLSQWLREPFRNPIRY